MQDLERLGRQLGRGRSEQLRALAGSADGERLTGMVDGAAIERAVRSGDGVEMQRLLQGVLSTAEGQRLAREIRRVLDSGR